MTTLRHTLLLVLAALPTVQLLLIPPLSPPQRVPTAPARVGAALRMCATPGDEAGEAAAATPEAEAQAAAEAAEAAPDDAKAAIKAEKEALRDAIAELEAKLPKARGDLAAAMDSAKDAGENGYMLLAANFERYRQQARSELDSQKGYGRVAAVRALLPFAEAFEALQEGAAVDGPEGEAIHKYYGGIYKQTQQMLEGWKVAPYDVAPGDAFDLKLHQVTERLVSESAPANTILTPIERGWKMGDEVVRLAKVTISSGPPAPEEPAPAEEEAADAAPTEEAA